MWSAFQKAVPWTSRAMATRRSSSWKTNRECFCLLEEVFSKRGYQVLVASDGEQAIEVYRCYKLRIDVVLLDVGLPKIPGWQVFLKMKEENPAVRVVIASGYLDPKIKADLSGAGVKHFVAKPYVLDDLVETIGDVIERK